MSEFHFRVLLDYCSYVFMLGKNWFSF